MEQLHFEQGGKESLKEKYDGKSHTGVRGIRKQLMLEQNPEIIKEKGDKEWIEYLYNTPMSGELESYKTQLEKKLNEMNLVEVVDPTTEDIFDPSTGNFKGFLSEEEKRSAIKAIETEIEELSALIEK